MKPCAEINRYLDGWMDKPEITAFEEHAADCTSCRNTIENWKILESACKSHTAKQDAEVPSEIEIHRIVSAAKRSKRHSSSMKQKVVAIGVVVATAAACAAFILLTANKNHTAPDSITNDTQQLALTYEIVTKDGTTANKLDNPKGARLSAPANGGLQASVGSDRIGLGAGGTIEIKESSKENVHLVLAKGSVACSVSKRSNGREFVVSAGQYKIRVVGTRFSVSLGKGNELQVAVDEGTVEVIHKEYPKVNIQAGNRFTASVTGIQKKLIIEQNQKTEIGALLGEIDETESGETTAEKETEIKEKPNPAVNSSNQVALAEQTKKPTGFSIGEARRLIVERRLDEAESGIIGHLKKQPNDYAAWMLLGDCLRNSGKWQPAVEAYSHVLMDKDISKANRARFFSGTILQDRLGRHAEAIRNFDAYVSAPSGNPLKAEAKLHLAKSLIATSNLARARRVLEDIQATHGGTSASDQAADLLLKMEVKGNE